MKFYPFLAFFVLLCGSHAYAQKPPPQNTPTQPAGITESQALAIAEGVIREKNPNVKDFEIKAKFKKGQWRVFAQFVWYDKHGNPAYQVGGHCWVVLDTTGQVLRYIPGA